MTNAKAQTVAAALIALGYTVTVTNTNPITSDWTVTASGSSIAASAVATFATAQAVTGTVSSASFN